MVSWILFALLAPLSWAICNIINKIVRIKYIDNSISYSILIAPIDLLVLFLLFFTKLDIPSFGILLVILLAGFISVFGLILYFKALSNEEVSRVIPLFRFVSIFVLLLATIFLGERLHITDYWAFALIVLGGFLISMRKVKNMFRLGNVFFIVLFSSFIYAVYDVLVKYSSSFTNVMTIFILGRVGYAIGALFLFGIPLYRKNTLKIARRLNKKTVPLIMSAEIAGLIGVFFSYSAISLAPVSLVSSLESFQPLFVLIFASLLSFKFPSLIKEELNRKVLLIKVIAIVLMILGVWLLYLK